MKKILVVFILSYPGLAIAETKDSFVCESLTGKQITVLADAYMYGEPYDLSHSLMGIAWQESLAGKWKIQQHGSASFGTYHINIKTAMKRLGKKNSNFASNMVAQQLVEDDRLSASLAVQELEFWKRVHKGDWKRIWASYNNGYRWKHKSSLQYSENIGGIIKKVNRCAPVVAMIEHRKMSRNMAMMRK